MMKILIIQTASLGDVILATATANSIKELFPDCNISFLVKDSCAEVIRNNPVIDNIIVWNKSKRKYKNLFNVIKYVRYLNFDIVINFQRFFSSGLISALSKSSVIIGYKDNPLSVFFKRKIKHSIHSFHETERNLILANTYFQNLKLAKPVVDIEIPKNEEISALENKKFITIFPGSLWQTKQLPIRKWCDFVKTVPDSIFVVIAGSKSDSSFANIIMEARPTNILNVCGVLNIRESAWLMKKAYMNFTNDSAPTHLASAVNANVTTVFCSTVPAFGFTPLSDVSNIVECLENLDCRPCGIHGHVTCPKKHFDCGHKIEVSQLTSFLEL